MASGFQICSASASRSQRASSASSAARRHAIDRNARSTVCQSPSVSRSRRLGAHVGAASSRNMTTHSFRVVRPS
jgi:hypothetical protein